MFLCQYFTYNDLEQTGNAVTTSHEIDEILPLFKSIKGKGEKVIIHSQNDRMEIKDE
jgi:hypothetical protein